MLGNAQPPAITAKYGGAGVCRMLWALGGVVDGRLAHLYRRESATGQDGARGHDVGASRCRPHRL